MQLTIEGFETLWLLNVHLFLNLPIEEWSLRIHLVDLPLHLSWQCQHQSNRWVPCYGRKGLIAVDPLDLWETTSNKPCLLFLNTTINCLLYLVKSSRTHHWFSLRPWDNIPHIVTNDRVILLYHGINKDWFAALPPRMKKVRYLHTPQLGPCTQCTARAISSICTEKMVVPHSPAHLASTCQLPLSISAHL